MEPRNERSAERADGANGEVGVPSLPEIPTRRLSFELESRTASRLSEFKGSMLRGAFGHALRRTVCTMGSQQECEPCPLRTACPHARLFETFIEGEPPPFCKGLKQAPRPYLLEVAEERRLFAPGERFAFDLLLLGSGRAYEPYARLAVERMAPAGLGSGKAPFDVSSIVAENGSTCTASDLAAEAPDRLRLSFLTPTRFKVNGELVASPTPRQLVFQMLRRVLEIAAFHLPGATVDWSFHGLLDHASTLAVEHSDLHWHDWRRYSNRQKTDMLLGGFIGEMTLAGDLAPLLPLVRAVEVLHVGKGTTFGLGWVKAEEVHRGERNTDLVCLGESEQQR